MTAPPNKARPRERQTAKQAQEEILRRYKAGGMTKQQAIDAGYAHALVRDLYGPNNRQEPT